MSYPQLDDVVKADDVSCKGTGKFAASYVNWAKVSHLLRTNAPGWQPYYVGAADGGMCHEAPDGTFYLLIGFRHSEEGETVAVPHAVMDHKMNAKSNVSARDISDAYVRGMCKAAALLFGLGWRLWSKDDPFEREDEPQVRKVPVKQQRVAVTFTSKDDAMTGLAKVKDKATLERWCRVVKDSSLNSDDSDDLREAYRERIAIMAEAGA